MKAEVENVSDVKKVIHFEVPWEEVNEHVKKAVRILSKSARVPGFRPGKAPEKIIRTRYAEHIKEEVIHHVVPKAYEQALKENPLDIISDPGFEDILYSEGSPLKFKVSLETRPTIDPQDYKGIPLKGTPLEVQEEEVDGVLKDYQERAAELVPCDRAAEKGLFVHTKVRAVLAGDKSQKTLFDGPSLIEVEGEGNHPLFNENLAGKKAGDSVDFTISYEADYSEASLAGKSVHYELKIESVNERRLPSIDDEFARDLGDFQSLEDLKEKIHKDLLQLHTNRRRNNWKDEALKNAVERNPFEVPDSLVLRETENLMKSYAYSLHQQGMDVNRAQIDWKEIQGRLSHQADRNVRGALLLEAIAKKEGIQVADEDVEKYVEFAARQEQRAPEAVKADWIKEKRMDSVKERIMLTKTMDFLVDNAAVDIQTEENESKSPKREEK